MKIRYMERYREEVLRVHSHTDWNFHVKLKRFRIFVTTAALNAQHDASKVPYFHL